MSFQMYVPTRILFGKGQLEGLHKQKLPGKKAMNCDFQWEIDKEKRSFGKDGKRVKTGRCGNGSV